jgi:hypothetical protein
MGYLYVKMTKILSKVEILILELLGFIQNCRMSEAFMSRSYLERGELTSIFVKI